MTLAKYKFQFVIESYSRMPGRWFLFGMSTYLTTGVDTQGSETEGLITQTDHDSGSLLLTRQNSSATKIACKLTSPLTGPRLSPQTQCLLKHPTPANQKPFKAPLLFPSQTTANMPILQGSTEMQPLIVTAVFRHLLPVSSKCRPSCLSNCLPMHSALGPQKAAPWH